MRASNTPITAAPVLVVDDDRTILELVRTVLTDEGLEVVGALDGCQAMSRCREARPALVVLDMYIPGLSGAELARELRRVAGDKLPILVMSASSVDQQARALGAFRYLPKPFDLTDLLAAVHEGLGLALAPSHDGTHESGSPVY